MKRQIGKGGLPGGSWSRASALLELAVQGDEDIAHGRTATLEQHRERIADLLRAGRRG
jgi:hypothetical protein